MADTAISALTAATAAAGTMAIPVSDSAGVSNKKLTVTQLEAYFGWHMLGETTLGSAAARTSDVIWTGDYKIIKIQYLIAGYAGSAVGRILLGSGSLSEIGTDCSCELIERTTANTTAVSICGWPTAVTTSTNRRWGEFVVNNVTGSSVREAYGTGMHGGAAGTVATGMQMSGFKSAIAQLDRARMTSFSAIIGNTVGSNLNAGTYIRVWGLPA